MRADAARNADGAACARYEAKAHLGKGKVGLRRSEHMPSERRHFNTSPNASSVQSGGGAPGNTIDQTCRGTGRASQVRQRRISGQTKFVEIAAGAKGWACALKQHPLNRVICLSEG